MEPALMQAMAESMPKGRYLHCPNGSHMAMYDDPVNDIGGLIDFLRRANAAAG